MPSRILPDALKLLGRIYRFPGSVIAPKDAELDLPVQFVHDVSREAELGQFEWSDGRNSGRSSYFDIVVDNVHVGASTVRQLIGVYANSGSIAWQLSAFDPPNPQEETVWITGVSGLSDTVDEPASGYLLVRTNPKAGAGSGAPAWSMSTMFEGTHSGANTDGLFPIRLSSRQVQMQFPIPLTAKVANDTQLEFVTASGGAVVADLHVHCIRLPVGIWPPGLR